MSAPRLSRVLLYVVSMAAMIMLLVSVVAKNARQQYDFGGSLHKVELEGEYRAGSNPPVVFNPKDKSAFDSINDETVIFKGHTSAAIPAGKTVFVRIKHVRASIFVNGTCVFTIGDEKNRTPFTASPGNIWASFISHGISPGDTVEIRVSRVHHFSHPRQIGLLFNNMCYGSVWPLALEQMRKDWWTYPLGAFLASLALILGALATVFMIRGRRTLSAQAMLLVGMYFCSGMWLFIDYSFISLLLPWPTLVVTLESLLIIFSGIFILIFILGLLTGRRLFIGSCAAALVMLLTMVAIILQLAGIFDLFVSQRYIHIVLGLSVTVTLVCLFMERRAGNQTAGTALLTFVPVTVLSGLEVILYNSGHIFDGMLIGAGLFLTALLHVLFMINMAQNEAERAAVLEKQIVESRIAVSLSQIRPHFLYNVFTGIGQLCAVEPARAESAIYDFAAFLRGNLESLSSTAFIPVEKELEHARHYLALEEMRFGSRLRVDWNIKSGGFMVPALSIQPLVENAVRWGMREDGITIVISTGKYDGGHTVTVEDNGRGLNANAAGCGPTAREDGREHIGLASIHYRLAAMDAGRLEISTGNGGGVTAVIYISNDIKGKK